MPNPSPTSKLSDKPIIAIVGLSIKPERPSFGVARYMQEHGYRIIPVNPMYAGTHILGELCYKDLYQAANALAVSNLKIDIVDCFRKASDISPIVGEAIMISASCVWMQLGISHQDAADKAIKAGLSVIMDRCIKVEHALGNFHGVL
ncbi:CoA-binding protein [Glaciimonas sp. GG7]